MGAAIQVHHDLAGRVAIEHIRITEELHPPRLSLNCFGKSDWIPNAPTEVGEASRSFHRPILTPKEESANFHIKHESSAELTSLLDEDGSLL